MLLHTNNHFAKKRGIGKKLMLTVRNVMLQEHVEMVAGDVNGAAWRRQSGSDPRPISIIVETFVNTSLLVPPGSTPLWGPGGVPGEWSDVCGFLKPRGSEREACPHTRCLYYRFRHAGHQAHRSKLPSRSLGPPLSCECSGGWPCVTQR